MYPNIKQKPFFTISRLNLVNLLRNWRDVVLEECEKIKE